MGIEILREEINRIDTELMELIQARMKISTKIGDYKNKNGLPVFDGTREDAILEKISHTVGEDLVESVQELYRLLFALSRARQGEKTKE